MASREENHLKKRSEYPIVWHKMRILVTGASGFIGSHVVKALVNSGHDVLCFVLPSDNLWRLADVTNQIELLKGDLRSISNVRYELQKWRPTTCVHLAWYAEPGRYLQAAENLDSLRGSLDLLQILISCGCEQFIGTGTCAEYAMKSEKLSESDTTKPETLYAASKLSFQMLGERIAELSKIRFAWGRVFLLYGSYEDARRLVPSAIQKLQKGETFFSSPGEQVRDYLHVTDVANAFLSLVNNQATGIYNICSSEPVTVKSILDIIGTLMGKQELLAHGALAYREWEPKFICGNNSKLKAIGWIPQVNLVTGLHDTINWWKTQLEKNV
jgi:nucleoside-diphosphate-sugar epimerase